MTPVATILLFVEDPGAANLVIDLPQALERLGCRVVLMANGHAVSYLADRGTACHAVSEDTEADSLIDKIGPSVVATGTSENPDSLALDLIDGARRRGIPSASLVDMSCNAALRFKGRASQPLAHAPDYLVVPDATTRNAFLDLAYPPERIELLGHPQYERVWRRRLELEATWSRPSRKRPQWIFVAEGRDLLDPAASQRSSQYTLQGRGDTDWRTGIVLEEILDAAADMAPRPDIVVRLHPKTAREDFVQWAHEVSFDDSSDPFPSLWTADAVLGMSSMLIVEAAILGRPVLAVLPRIEERKWLGPLADGDIPSVTCRKDLLQSLENLASGRWQAASPAHWAKPGATERIARFLSGMS